MKHMSINQLLQSVLSCTSKAIWVSLKSMKMNWTVLLQPAEPQTPELRAINGAGLAWAACRQKSCLNPSRAVSRLCGSGSGARTHGAQTQAQTQSHAESASNVAQGVSRAAIDERVIGIQWVDDLHLSSSSSIHRCGLMCYDVTRVHAAPVVVECGVCVVTAQQNVVLTRYASGCRIPQFCLWRCEVPLICFGFNSYGNGAAKINTYIK